MSKIKDVIRPEHVVRDAFSHVKGIVVKCTKDEGMTQQSFKDECNINMIVEKYTKTGQWGNSLKPGTKVPMFGDFTAAPDYQECLDRMIAAQADFDSLPSRLRKRFNNDPYELLEFLQNKENKDEAVRLGIIEPAAPASPPEAGITPGAAGAK